MRMDAGGCSVDPDQNIDVAACGFRVGACLVGRVSQGFSYVSIQTGKAYIETGLERVCSVLKAEVYLRVYGRIGRKNDFHFTGGDAHCSFEVSRPTGSE